MLNLWKTFYCSVNIFVWSWVEFPPVQPSNCIFFLLCFWTSCFGLSAATAFLIVDFLNMCYWNFLYISQLCFINLNLALFYWSCGYFVSFSSYALVVNHTLHNGIKCCPLAVLMLADTRHLDCIGDYMGVFLCLGYRFPPFFCNLVFVIHKCKVVYWKKQKLLN